jgi:hypothetical protein
MHPLALNDTPSCDREPSSVTQDRRMGSVTIYSSNWPKDGFSEVSCSGEPEEVPTVFYKIAIVAAAVIFVVGCGTANDANQSSKTSGSGETTSPSMLAKSGPPEGTKSFQNLGYDHVKGSVHYRQIPPVGGDHASIWQNCGFYPEPVRGETAVHSMEHGAVWITYRPGLPAEQVDKLRDLASKTYVLVSLYPDLPTPVVASAWGKQLRLDSAEDPRLKQFVSAFRQGPQTPEPGVPCMGGTSKTVSQPVRAHE